MLILGRKKGEEIVIGRDIIVSVVDVGADTVKLAVQAPRDVPVLRRELLQAMEENREAAAGKGNAADLAALLHQKRQSKKGETL